MAWAVPALALLASCAGQEFGQATLDDDFESGKLAYDAYRGEVRIADDPAVAHQGRKALEWKYEIEKSQFNFITTALARGDLEGCSGVELWLRSDKSGPLLFQVREIGGATYQFYDPDQPVGSKWKRFRLPFARFERDSETPDDNGRLDLDRVAEFWIVDPSGYYKPSLVGKRTVWVDDVRRLRDEGAAKKDAGAAGNEAEARRTGAAPLIRSGPRGAANNLKSDPCVIRDGDGYRMWYGACPDGKGQQIFHARSPNGLDWRLDPDPAVPLGEPGQWDAGDVETPMVVRAGDTYHMWYCARAVSGEAEVWEAENAWQIGHATSKDGTKWTKDPRNPVLRLGDKEKNEWNWAAVAEPAAVYDPRAKRFHLWYVGANVRDGVTLFHVGHATSRDGSRWHDDPGNPVIDGSRSLAPRKQDHDEFRGFLAPFVFRHDGRYVMVFSCEHWNAQPTGPLLHAVSRDGRDWKLRSKPILDKSECGSWCSSGIFAPSILVEGDVMKIWFSGFRVTTSFQFGIGYVERPVRLIR